MKVNFECTAADLYLIAKALQMAEMQADRNMNTHKSRCRVYRTTVSKNMNLKRRDTYEYQRKLFGDLHDLFLNAIPQSNLNITVEPDFND